MDWEKEDRKYFGDIFKQINSKFHRCFWPKESCSEEAIRAHSIQNSGVLDLISENNHVIMPQMGLDIEKGPFLKFEEIGRNKATTFTGLCDKHDSELFKPLDTVKFDPGNIEQLFLLSYRSVMRELHAKMKAAVDIQSQYGRGVELGRFNPEIVDQPMKMATMVIAEAYSFYLYKFEYDKIYLSMNFKNIVHNVDYIENISPSIAVSSAFSFIDNMHYLEDRQNPKCVCLNIFPDKNGIFIIFSYRKDQEAKLLPYLERFFQAEKFYKLYIVSKLVLMYCENLVLSPKFYNNLSDERKNLIKDFFMQNIWGEKKDSENEALCLFN
ncbi:hypothetical protein [Desulfobacter postgatei]|jgi:hypothetical protein|uniref:hypothetical protein n=1 Tax=Desulfobacter postgatei TaxID=2293 RepID=UPI002A361E9C|nr:hypothetical protein [Desulfobacter postgatei]MDX9964097.1 hypothetical protein [Desulfobacter postgatei]